MQLIQGHFTLSKFFRYRAAYGQCKLFFIKTLQMFSNSYITTSYTGTENGPISSQCQSLWKFS